MLFKKLYFRYFQHLCRKGRYFHGLSLLSGNLGAFVSAETCWAYYKLGLYQMVVNSNLDSEDQNYLIARAASLAACGQVDHAKKTVETSLALHKNEPGFCLKLASAIAPFNKDIAYGIFEPDCIEFSPLQVALCERLGKSATLRRPISFSVASPQNCLIISNISSKSHEERLIALNTTLTSYSLTNVILKNDSKPLSVTNIFCEPCNSTEDESPCARVTVIMTTHNSAEYLLAAANSILMQTHSNLELIIVDDNSSDSTKEIIASLKQHDSRVISIMLNRNVGTYVAKTVGLMHASGDFVTCHDSDDWAHPLKLATQVEPLLSNASIIFSTSNLIRLDSNGRFYSNSPFPFVRLNSSSTMFRRSEILKNTGSWDYVRTGADSEFLNRLKHHYGAKAYCRIDKPLTLAAHRENSLMTHKDTGNKSDGMSPIRLQYWENFMQWHMTEYRKRKRIILRTEFDQIHRKFPAPSEIEVPRSDIEYTLNNLTVI